MEVVAAVKVVVAEVELEVEVDVEVKAKVVEQVSAAHPFWWAAQSRLVSALLFTRRRNISRGAPLSLLRGVSNDDRGDM